jgi:hypothetical protein
MNNYYVYATLEADIHNAVVKYCAEGTGPIGPLDKFHITINDNADPRTAEHLVKEYNNKVIHAGSYTRCCSYLSSNKKNYNVKISQFKYDTDNTLYSNHHMNICRGINEDTAQKMINKCQDVRDVINNKKLHADKTEIESNKKYENERYENQDGINTDAELIGCDLLEPKDEL